MLKTRLRIGVLGCGKIAQVRHIPEYAANPSVELVGFYDFVDSRAAEMAQRYGGRAFASAQELLACKDMDAVSICTPNYTHASLAIEALRGGKHVLCEKPMATTPAECELMVREADACGKMLLVAHNQRLWQVHQRAKALLEEGVIGKPLSFKTCFGHSGPDHWGIEQGTGNWFFDRSKSAFGVMADLGIHKLDLVQYLLGEEMKEVQAVRAVLDKIDAAGNPVRVEDNAVVLCRMASGVIGTVTVSWTYYGEEDNDTVIYGSKGTLEILSAQDLVRVRRQDGEVCEYRLPPKTTSGVIDDFVNAVLHGAPSAITVKAVLPAMRALFAAVEAADTGKKICL